MYDLSNSKHRSALEKAASDLLNGRRKPRKNAKRRSGEIKTSMPIDPWSRATRKTLLSKKNAPERRFRSLLKRCAVTFHRERPIEVDGKKYFIDFMVVSFLKCRTKVRIAIEIDGGYHFTPEQQERDAKKDADLMRCQRVWSILRISAENVMSMSVDELLSALRSMKPGMVVRIY